MNSIRTKITLLTVLAVVAALTLVTVIASISINKLGNETSEQILLLLCETGARNLDESFKSVEQSVKTVSDYACADLENTDLAHLGEHLERAMDLFEKTANNTSGILTYYYRIDPEVSDEKGFWFVNLDGNGFTEHEVTNISLYDTEDQSSLVWFTVPKATGESIWLHPYFTDTIDVYVLSYNVPIYKDGTFIGVIGIEIDYNTIVEPVKNITLYQNGYAFINDAEGTIIYHPHMEISDFTGENKPQAPKELLNSDTFIKYKYDGVEKQAVHLLLDNGMYINVTVPISEINGGWHKLLRETITVSAVLLLVLVALTMRFSDHITKPLRKLTEVAQQVESGNYDFEPDYKSNDEVGILTRTFSQLVGHLKTYISDLNNLAFTDALTCVHNKGAFDIYVRNLQAKLNESDEKQKFAIGVFDCNNLKQINDKRGHDKGDVYLKNSCALICGVFEHSPVFRTGGDEFSVILQNDAYQNREKLIDMFEKKCAEICASREEPWEKISVAIGVAVYNPQTDRTVAEVVRRADKLMYQNKRKMKSGR